MIKKLVFLGVLIVFFNTTLTAQFGGDNDHPVTVNLSEKKISDKITEVKVCFEIEEDWMVYDSVIGGEGPIPLEIEEELSRNLLHSTLKKPKLKQKTDDVFGVDILYFNQSVCYTIILEKKDSGIAEYAFSLQYMTCNLVSGTCLPPRVEDYKIIW